MKIRPEPVGRAKPTEFVPNSVHVSGFHFVHPEFSIFVHAQEKAFSATILNNHFFPGFVHIPKRYGQSKVDLCPFCEKAATAKNSQDLPVCQNHKKTLLPDLKCSCNSYLDLRKGKFGVYFSCMNCGNMNIKKALSLNPNLGINTNMPVSEAIGKIVNTPSKRDKKEITITSDEVDINYS